MTCVSSGAALQLHYMRCLRSDFHLCTATSRLRARVKQAVDGTFASAALDRFCYRTSYFDYLLVQIVNHNLKC